MKRFLLAGLVLIAGPLFAGPVLAADLGRGPTVSPEPFEYRPVNDGGWGGFYLGLTYGYATGWTDVATGGSAFDIDTDGGIGTAFIGYNWQIGRLIAGLEADIGTGSFDGSENGVSTEIDHVGSVRGRLGYLVTPSFLLYATGGFAYAGLDFQANGDTESETFTGYQIGAGTELKFSDPWSLRLEYIYTDFDSETLNHNGVANTYDPDFHTVRAGLSYKF